MRIAVCDDEREAVEYLAGLVQTFDRLAEWAVFSDADSLLRAMETERADIVLLDIGMEGLNGYEAARRLKDLDSPPLVIFTTRSGDYAVRGYEVAFRYLQKPINYEDFNRAMAAAYDKLAPRRLAVPGRLGETLLDVDRILYLESANYVTRIVTETETYTVRRSLKSMETELAGAGFARCHAGYLVNLDRVRSVAGGQLTLTDGTPIPVSRQRKKAFEQALMAFLRR